MALFTSITRLNLKTSGRSALAMIRRWFIDDQMQIEDGVISAVREMVEPSSLRIPHELFS
ncbi:MAG: hypothetical protein AUJ20_12395 [Comamonadaceae bacterium CG1_02_60_18]|nr:MAG: hypothetical protein AUJ20_12395 [Comamonadaceae bacterium CG1_02_60_18]